MTLVGQPEATDCVDCCGFAEPDDSAKLLAASFLNASRFGRLIADSSNSQLKNHCHSRLRGNDRKPQVEFFNRLLSVESQSVLRHAAVLYLCELKARE